MNATFLREADAMTRIAESGTREGLFAALGRLLESVVEAHARQEPSPDRQLPPEWFQYPIV